MAVTLATAKAASIDAVEAALISEFQENPLLNLIPIKDAAVPGGGNSLDYAFRRVTKYPGAAARAYNTEYTADSAESARVTVSLRPLGGAVDIDRAFENLGFGGNTVLAEQLQLLARSTSAEFVTQAITGKAATGFDGLSTALAGTPNEVTTPFDWSPAAQGMTSQLASRILMDVNSLIRKLDGAPSVILGTEAVVSTFQMAAAFLNRYTQAVGYSDSSIGVYNGATVTHAGLVADNSAEIIPLTGDGEGQLYVVRLGETGFHAVTAQGSAPIRYYSPQPTHPGAVRRHEVEMGPIATALKSRRAAAVARKIKVA